MSGGCKRRAFESAGQILDGLLKRPDLAKRVRECSVIPFWAEAVGDEISKISKPERIAHGRILHVRVSNAAWAQELSFRKEELLSALQNADPSTLINDLRFKVGSAKDFSRQS